MGYPVEIIPGKNKSSVRIGDPKEGDIMDIEVNANGNVDVKSNKVPKVSRGADFDVRPTNSKAEIFLRLSDYFNDIVVHNTELMFKQNRTDEVVIRTKGKIKVNGHELD